MKYLFGLIFDAWNGFWAMVDDALDAWGDDDG